MRFLLTIPAMILASSAAVAHGFKAGPLEIRHPSIMVPSEKSDCSCAHVKIVNHGKQTEYFLGAEISAASRTHLIEVASGGTGLKMPMRVEIPPGQTLDLSPRAWCLFMSGIKRPLEAYVGEVKGQLLFERQGKVEVEFMIEPAND